METDAGCKAQTRAPWTAGRCPVPHVGARHGVRISFACPSPFPHLSEPQRYMLRMKGLMDDGGQAGGKLAQIDLVTQPLAESGECAGRIVSTSDLEPQRYMLRMKGLMDDGGQAGGKLAQIDLVTQPLAESGECAGRIVST